MGGARRQARAWAYVYMHPSSSSPCRRRRRTPIPCRIHTYIYYAVTATIPFFVWLELARLPPSLAYENQQKEEHADGRKGGRTDGRTTAIPHISSRSRQRRRQRRRRRRLRQRHTAQFPFLPSPSSLPRSSLFVTLHISFSLRDLAI